jgi:hypothetical protein
MKSIMKIHTEYQKDKMQDPSYRTDILIDYSIKKVGKHKKLIGQTEEGFRSFAYIDECVSTAKQAIRMDYLMQEWA